MAKPLSASEVRRAAAQGRITQGQANSMLRTLSQIGRLTEAQKKAANKSRTARRGRSK